MYQIGGLCARGLRHKMRFAYTYRSSDGQRHTAEIEAESRDAAFAKVHAELGIKPIKVTASGPEEGRRQDGGSPYGGRRLPMRECAKAARPGGRAAFHGIGRNGSRPSRAYARFLRRPRMPAPTRSNRPEVGSGPSPPPPPPVTVPLRAGSPRKSEPDQSSLSK